MPFIKPNRLRKGDIIAAVSLSSGLANSIRHRYESGKRQLEEALDVRVIESPNALRDDSFLSRNPEARADDLAWALTNPEVRGIVCTIGGFDSVRIMPFLEAAVIRTNPKVFLGSSDATVQHMGFATAGVVSFYGPSVMTDLAETGGIRPYVSDALRRMLFHAESPGEIEPSEEWSEQHLDWNDPTTHEVRRAFEPNPGWKWIQGTDAPAVEGHLMGGCMEVLEMLKGTSWWPEPAKWEGAILYFETSELKPELWQIEAWLRNYGVLGILSSAKAILFGRPYGFGPDDRAGLAEVIRRVMAEFGASRVPVVTEMDFGHTSPMGVLPNGCPAKVDPAGRTVAFTEAAVV